MQQIKNSLRNQLGFSLIETLAAIVLLGTCLALLLSFMYQNFLAIDLNTKKEEAIFIRDDLKEWLTYKGQSQDIARLNPFVFESRAVETIDEEERSRHLIIDESGIQYVGETSQTLYGELPRDSRIDRGQTIQKVHYDFTGDTLPEKLKNPMTNRFYIGEYLDFSGNFTGYLVEIKKIEKDFFPAFLLLSYRPPLYLVLSDYMPWAHDRKQGIGIQIIIYDKESGEFLTETFLYWVVEY